MAASYPFMWVDAFTEVAMGGNPCAVVFDADDIPAEIRTAYVRETGLVECAYLQCGSRPVCRFILPIHHHTR